MSTLSKTDADESIVPDSDYLGDIEATLSEWRGSHDEAASVRWPIQSHPPKIGETR
jgi:hypothetical protein